MSEGGGDDFEVVHSFGIGLLVNAVQRSYAVVFQISGDTFVGREHEFFNQAVRDVALGTGNTFHQSKFVEFDHGLGQIEVDGAAPLALAIQNEGEVAHHLESPNQAGVALACGSIAFEHRVDVGVGHALGGTDDAFAQLIFQNLSPVVDLHDAGKHEPVHVRAQAADIGREFERQHGHGAIGEVDAGAAQSRLLIEGRIGRDVVGHVRDVYLQFVVAIFDLPDGDRVVEVAGSLAVDSDDREERGSRAVLWASGARDDRFDILRFVEHFGRKMMRQVEFADDDLDIDAEIVFVAQDLDHSSPRILGGRGPVGDFDIHHYVFQIVPFGAASGFVAQNAVDGFLLFLEPCRLPAEGGTVHRDAGATRVSPFPAGLRSPARSSGRSA